MNKLEIIEKLQVSIGYIICGKSEDARRVNNEIITELEQDPEVIARTREIGI